MSRTTVLSTGETGASTSAVPHTISTKAAETTTLTLPQMDSTIQTTTLTLPQIVSTKGAETTTPVFPWMDSTIGAETTTLTLPQIVSDGEAETTTFTLPQIVSTTGAQTTATVTPHMVSTTGAKTAAPGWLQMATTPGDRPLTSPSPPHIATKQQNISYIDSSVMHGGLEEAPVLSGSSARHGGLEEVTVLVVVSSFCLVLLVILVIVVFRCLILRRGKYYTHEQNEAEDPKDELEDFSDKELLGEICPMNEQNDVEDIKE